MFLALEKKKKIKFTFESIFILSHGFFWVITKVRVTF